MSSAILEAAIRWQAAGVAALPVKADGTKGPGLPTWKEYQQRLPTPEETAQWFGRGRTGVGVVTGPVSGQLEMLEFEGRAVDSGLWRDYQQAAADNGLDELLRRVADGYTERTPSGGIHLLYRVADGAALPNTKLARDEQRNVLIETRGDGGFVVVAPSSGTTHGTGRPWTMIAGSIETVATITADERDALYALASLLDRTPEPAQQPTSTSSGLLAGTITGTRPGDDYNARATWEELLEPRGWRKVRPMGRGWYWAKPGKKGPGGSATTGQSGDGADRLFVFSTSTEFDPERPYSKFAAYALLEHAGDHSAAAKALAAAGYGTPAQQATTSPAAAPTLPSDQPPRSHLTGAATVTETPAITLAQSEDGHSQALIAQYGPELRYCPQMGRWLWWDGYRWARQPASGGIAREYAKGIARGYPDDKEWATHKKRSLTSAGIGACLSLTQTDYRITVDIDDLDARPWELNTPGGIIDLRTGTLRPPDPKALHTRSTLVAPDPDGDLSPWLDFLNTTFTGDHELIGYVQRLLGYGCVGAVREAILPVFYGQGANGKTVLLETVQAVLGDYATVAPQKFLVQGPAQHATEVAALAGARLVIASETNEGERFDEAKVKLLTGGDRIKARFMRQDEFTFIPSHLLVMMTNHRPEVGSGGTSFWRRVREVPFANIVPEAQRDPELKDRLVERHGPAIMAWLAQGAAQYAQHGLGEPEGVRRATKAYEAATDTVARFVDDMVILGGGENVKTNYARVREAYEAWCRTEGETPVTAKTLTTQLMAKFDIGRFKGSKGVRFLTGMTLVGSATPDDDDVPPRDDDQPWGGR